MTFVTRLLVIVQREVASTAVDSATATVAPSERPVLGVDQAWLLPSRVRLALNADGWAFMQTVTQEEGETNGVFRFGTVILPPVGQRSGFYRIKSGP